MSNIDMERRRQISVILEAMRPFIAAAGQIPTTYGPHGEGPVAGDEPVHMSVVGFNIGDVTVKDLERLRNVDIIMRNILGWPSEEGQQQTVGVRATPRPSGYIEDDNPLAEPDYGEGWKDSHGENWHGWRQS